MVKGRSNNSRDRFSRAQPKTASLLRVSSPKLFANQTLELVGGDVSRAISAISKKIETEKSERKLSAGFTHLSAKQIKENSRRLSGKIKFYERAIQILKGGI